MNYPTIWPHFFTATIYKWNNLLKNDNYKDIIIDCLKFLVDDNRVEVNAFVIMSNHVHITCLPAGRYGTRYNNTPYLKFKPLL